VREVAMRVVKFGEPTRSDRAVLPIMFTSICTFHVDPSMSVERAHRITHEVARAVRDAFPEVADVMIHTGRPMVGDGGRDDRALVFGRAYEYEDEDEHEYDDVHEYEYEYEH